MLTTDQVKEKWHEIKGGILNVWGKITEEELDEINGDLSQLTNIVENKYRQSKKSIGEDIKKILDSFDNESDKADFDTNVSSYKRRPEDYANLQKSRSDQKH